MYYNVQYFADITYDVLWILYAIQQSYRNQYFLSYVLKHKAECSIGILGLFGFVFQYSTILIDMRECWLVEVKVYFCTEQHYRCQE